MAASFQFTSPGLPFKASEGWVQDFKKEHQAANGISGVGVLCGVGFAATVLSFKLAPVRNVIGL
jgi:hypothetical protein